MPLEEKMRDELLAFQAAQRDILRWKLIAAGSVGATGLALKPHFQSSALLIASLLPLIALFCDVVYRDHDLRVAMIASFLGKKADFFREYEQFVSDCAPWATIGWVATLGSSLFIAVATLAGASVAYCRGEAAALPAIITATVTLVTAPSLEFYFLTVYRRIRRTPVKDFRTSSRAESDRADNPSEGAA